MATISYDGTINTGKIAPRTLTDRIGANYGMEAIKMRAAGAAAIGKAGAELGKTIMGIGENLVTVAKNEMDKDYEIDEATAKMNFAQGQMQLAHALEKQSFNSAEEYNKAYEEGFDVDDGNGGKTHIAGINELLSANFGDDKFRNSFAYGHKIELARMSARSTSDLVATKIFQQRADEDRAARINLLRENALVIGNVEGADAAVDMLNIPPAQKAQEKAKNYATYFSNQAELRAVSCAALFDAQGVSDALAYQGRNSAEYLENKKKTLESIDAAQKEAISAIDSAKCPAGVDEAAFEHNRELAKAKANKRFDGIKTTMRQRFSSAEKESARLDTAEFKDWKLGARPTCERAGAILLQKAYTEAEVAAAGKKKAATSSSAKKYANANGIDVDAALRFARTNNPDVFDENGAYRLENVVDEKGNPVLDENGKPEQRIKQQGYMGVAPDGSYVHLTFADDAGFTIIRNTDEPYTPEGNARYSNRVQETVLVRLLEDMSVARNNGDTEAMAGVLSDASKYLNPERAGKVLTAFNTMMVTKDNPQIKAESSMAYPRLQTALKDVSSDFSEMSWNDFVKAYPNAAAVYMQGKVVAETQQDYNSYKLVMDNVYKNVADMVRAKDEKAKGEALMQRYIKTGNITGTTVPPEDTGTGAGDDERDDFKAIAYWNTTKDKLHQRLNKIREEEGWASVIDEVGERGDAAKEELDAETANLAARLESARKGNFDSDFVDELQRTYDYVRYWMTLPARGGVREIMRKNPKLTRAKAEEIYYRRSRDERERKNKEQYMILPNAVSAAYNTAKHAAGAAGSAVKDVFVSDE